MSILKVYGPIESRVLVCVILENVALWFLNSEDLVWCVGVWRLLKSIAIGFLRK